MSAPSTAGRAVVGVTAFADRVGVVVRANAASPYGHQGGRLAAAPVVVIRQGADVARWVRDAVLAVRLAVIAATAPERVPPVAVPRPLAGGNFQWHPLICGALLATPGLEVALVAPRWVNQACQQRLAAADAADPFRSDPRRDPEGFTRWRGRHPLWSQGYPPELVGPREQSGAGVRLVLRAAWDVAGAAGLRLAARGGAVA